MIAELGFEVHAFDRYQTRLVAGKDGSGDRADAVFGGHGEAHQHLIVARLGLQRLADADVALTAKDRGVDDVDRSKLRREQRGQRSRGQWLYVEIGDRTFIVERYRLDSTVGQLTGEAPDLLGEFHVGL